MKENQKVWIVYGGDYGVGSAAVRFILSKGDYVIMLLTAIGQSGPEDALLHKNLEYVSMPSDQKHAVKEMLDEVLSRHPTIDVLLCHGMISRHFILVAMRLFKNILPFMLPRLKGQIIFISSDRQSSYSTGSSRIFRLFESFLATYAPQLDKMGISVSNFLPSYINERLN